MSLRVWLPLNGDLRNNGLSNLKIIGAPLSWTDGKIGKCIHFNGTIANKIYCNTTELNYTDNFSFAFWIKQNYYTEQTSGAQYLFTVGRADGAYWGYGVQIANDSTIRIRFGNQAFNIACLANEWHHIAISIIGGKIYSYKDGVLYSIVNVGSVLPTYENGVGLGIGCFYYSGGSIYPYYGDLNDFRIYDHALSAKEVKELSKGLVCHYPLNDNAGQENLFNWGNKGNKIITLNNYQNTGSFTQFSGCLTFDAKDTVGTTYTISFWAKSPNGTTSLLLYNNNSTPRYFYFSPTTLTTSLNNEWQYFTYTFTNQDRGSGTTTASTYNRIEIYMPSQMGGQVKLIKIEEGEKATSWSPAPSDTYYNKLGYDKNIIYDTSGYGNNASIWRYDSLGNIEFYTDSPRNSLSTYINSENNTTNTASGTVYLYGNCSLTTPNYLTISFWCKPLGGYGGQTSQGQFCTTSNDIGANAGADYSTTAMHNRDSYIDMCTSTNIHKTPAISFTKDEWHHYVIVYDGRYGKIYKDTIQTSSCDMGDNLSLASFKAIVIGFSKAGGVWRSNKSYYSDFRLYSTALSEEDIKELYNIGASIDKNGNVFAYEFKED